jgi:hypothetical protein
VRSCSTRQTARGRPPRTTLAYLHHVPARLPARRGHVGVRVHRVALEGGVGELLRVGGPANGEEQEGGAHAHHSAERGPSQPHKRAGDPHLAPDLRQLEDLLSPSLVFERSSTQRPDAWCLRRSASTHGTRPFCAAHQYRKGAGRAGAHVGLVASRQKGEPLSCERCDRGGGPRARCNHSTAFIENQTAGEVTGDLCRSSTPAHP